MKDTLQRLGTLVLLALGVVLLAACGGQASTAPTPTPPPPPTATPTPVPTATPTPTPTPTPEPLSEETFRTLYGPAVTTLAGLAMAQQAVQNLQAGEGSLGDLTLLMGATLVLSGTEGVLNEPPPIPEVAGSWTTLRETASRIRRDLGRWMDDDLSSDELLDRLGTAVEDVSQAVAEMDRAVLERYAVTSADLKARKEGLVQEFQDRMEEALAEAAPTPTPTPTPTGPGARRSDPIPLGEAGEIDGWKLRVVEVVRGTEAWRRIEAANLFNDPPPKGTEYVLVRVWVKDLRTQGDETRSIGALDFDVTGHRGVVYPPASVVEPDPALDLELFPGGEGEGWISFLVPQDEENLVLIFEEALSFDSTPLFLALEEGARVETPVEELAAYPVNDLGRSLQDPAPFGAAVGTEEWWVQVAEVVRGEEAWRRIEGANLFNDPPAEGMEYVLVRVRVRYIGNRERPVGIDEGAFGLVGERGQKYDRPFVVPPAPALDVRLFPGGAYEGWVVLQAAAGEKGLVLIFDPSLGFSRKGRRYLSLEP